MSTTAKRKRPPEAHIRRPFDPRVLRRARAIADRYQLVLWQEDGRWFAHGVEEPGTFGDGRTIARCVKDTREALPATVAYLIEADEPVVTPVIDRERKSRRKAG